MNATPQALPLLQDVAQIAFTVRNQDEARAFYSDVLGLKFLFDAGNMSFFECGSVRLMLSQADQPAVSEGTVVYFRVADLHATAQVISERGAHFVQEPHLVARMKSHDLWMAFLKDPSGNTLGLMSENNRAKE